MISSSVIRSGVLIFVLSLSVRVGLMVKLGTYQELERTEMINVAVSVASGQGIANAFAPDSGPTAHVSPAYPILMSAIFRFFGTGAKAAFLQQFLGCAITSLTYSLLPALAVATGFGPVAGVVAGVISAVLPLNAWAERGTFENPLTALMIIAILLAAQKIWSTQGFSNGAAAGCGLLCGLALSVSPVPAVVIGGLLAVLIFKRRMAVLRFAAVVILITALILTPWTLRNLKVLGAPIWSRSNFALELSLSNADNSYVNLEDNVSRGVHARLHPYANPDELARLKRIGEVRYNAEKMEIAKQWILTHPAGFIRFTLAHIWYFWFPLALRDSQTWLLRGINLLMFAGIFIAFRKPTPGMWMCAIVLVCYPLPYYIVEVHSRYYFSIQPIRMLFAAVALTAAAQALRKYVQGDRLSEAPEPTRS